MQKKLAVVIALCMCSVFALADPAGDQSAITQIVDRIAAKEAENLKVLKTYAPMAETYVQTFKSDRDLGRVPADDHYFLGRVSFKNGLQNDNYLSDQDRDQEPVGFLHRWSRRTTEFGVHHRVGWVPVGFAQMAILDIDGLDRSRYEFTFKRRENLGSIRCLVFDVVPAKKSGRGRFFGRIWVEDQDYNIVRFNGTYMRPQQHTAYLHFDSWRTNVAPGRWLPLSVYGEESEVNLGGAPVALRAQTRFWGYAASIVTAPDLSTITVDSKDSVRDESGVALSPVAATREWNRQAENNILERLEQAGLIAPSSEMDKVLTTVVNNLIVTNDLTVDPEIHTRILLTAPLESFVVGHTIVISRGLIDVLPDEASLAAVLARELSHIVLGHGIDTKFSFADRVLIADDSTLTNLAMLHTPEEEAEADKRAHTILLNSPYKDKLTTVGLFLRQLDASHKSLPNLVRSHLGSSLIEDNGTRMSEFAQTAPQLAPTDLTQIAALPLGARVEVNPWDCQVTMSKAKSVPMLNPREKMPLELTPVFPYLTRVGAEPLSAQATGGEQ
jgi:hypothetical protein